MINRHSVTKVSTGPTVPSPVKVKTVATCSKHNRKQHKITTADMELVELDEQLARDEEEAEMKRSFERDIKMVMDSLEDEYRVLNK